jgi:Predicted membrane protein
MVALTRRFDTLGLLLLRVIVGFLIAAHGFQKLTTIGPAGFGRGALDPLGVPAPVVFGYIVAFAELVGGVLLILGLLTRLVALVLTIDLIVAIVLVKVKVGLIAQMAAGAELDLAYIAAFLALFLMGPGALPSIA